MYNTIVTKSKLAHSYLLAKEVPIFFFANHFYSTIYFYLQIYLEHYMIQTQI